MSNLAWFDTRSKGKETRKSFDAIIDEYIYTHDVSANYIAHIKTNYSDAINRFVFGKTAKQLCEERGCFKENLRDTHSTADLSLIEAIESYARRCVELSGMEPLEAIKAAIDFNSQPLF